MTTAYVTHPRYIEHTLRGHPEHAGRIEAVWDTLAQANLTNQMHSVEATPCTDEHILSVHTPEYMKLLDAISKESQGVRLDMDTYVLPVSPEITRLSTGGIINVVDTVLNGNADNALAVTRPPGHHAIPERGMGFCLLGNVAIAAKHAQKQHGIKKVMIVDYDVHHGNGTHDMFYDDDSVLFISTHQSPYYPGTGQITETGRGDGRGYTVNIPLSAGHGDESYLQIYREVIWPLARRFQPELIIVSAGFDAHWVDPLASMMLSLNGYATLDRELMQMAHELCGGKIVFVMEGGYDLTALGHGVSNIARALLGQSDISDPLGSQSDRSPDIAPLISQLQKIHGL